MMPDEPIEMHGSNAAIQIIDVKDVDPKNKKNVKKRVFMKR